MTAEKQGDDRLHTKTRAEVDVYRNVGEAFINTAPHASGTLNNANGRATWCQGATS